MGGKLKLQPTEPSRGRGSSKAKRQVSTSDQTTKQKAEPTTKSGGPKRRASSPPKPVGQAKQAKSIRKKSTERKVPKPKRRVSTPISQPESEPQRRKSSSWGKFTDFFTKRSFFGGRTDRLERRASAPVI